ncbi:MAG: phage holin family protein [Oscillospiraceae bacterium]|nr:phage holin family protein [Oscillospiraceae bacterium]
MENNIGKIKACLIAFGTALTAWLGALAIPVYLLVGCNLIDYFTGLSAAPFRDQKRNSRTGIKGIIKKIAMWVLVLIGFFIDMLLAYLADTVGWTLPISYAVAALVCVWLIANELLSIIENISDIGIDVPFLRPLVEWVKGKAETAGKLEDSKKE